MSNHISKETEIIVQYVHCTPAGRSLLESQERDGRTMKKIGVRGCRKRARDTGVWKLILKEAKVVRGQ